MKLTESQLRQIIREELMNEDSTTRFRQSALRELEGTLRKAEKQATSLGSWSDDAARIASEISNLLSQVKKIKP